MRLFPRDHNFTIPTCSSGNQNTTSLSALAIILYRGFHSASLVGTLHGSEHIGFSCRVSTSTWPCVSHTIASLSAPLPPTKYLPSALKQTSPCPRCPGCPGGGRKFEGCAVERGQCAFNCPSKASRRRWPVLLFEASNKDLPSFENSSFVHGGVGAAACCGVK